MVKDNTKLIIYAAIGIAAIYYLDKTFSQKPWTQEQTQTAIQAAGGTVTSGKYGNFWQVPGGSVSTENWTPNAAQRILIGLDQFVPGDWLSRKVLGV